MRELWTSKHRISRIIKHAWVNQEKLLVARNVKWYQEICLEMLKIPAEKSVTHEESRRTSSIGNILRIIAEN